MKIPNVKHILHRNNDADTKDPLLKILNPEALKKTHSVSSKAFNLQCPDCDMMDHGCSCDMNDSNY